MNVWRNRRTEVIYQTPASSLDPRFQLEVTTTALPGIVGSTSLFRAGNEAYLIVSHLSDSYLPDITFHDSAEVREACLSCKLKTGYTLSWHQLFNMEKFQGFLTIHEPV